MKMKRMHILLAGVALAAALVSAVQAANLRATVRTDITGNYTGSNDFGTPSFSLSAFGQAPITFANGTGSGQANAVFSDQRALSASATEQLDLFGSLTDPLGGTLNFATVKIMKVCGNAANTNDVLVGGAASNTFVGPFNAASQKIAVRPGGCAMFVAPQTGWTVTNTTGDKLEIGNGGAGTSITYDVFIGGTQ
jgi:hypothetical protein